jgi:hypothetical protein
MKNFNVPTGRPTPLPGRESFIKIFLSAIGDPDHVHQDKLAKDMGALGINPVLENSYM